MVQNLANYTTDAISKDPRGLAPQGYHIPSMEEWKQLSTFLGGDLLAGKKNEVHFRME